jgi:hypothetical protein
MNRPLIFSFVLLAGSLMGSAEPDNAQIPKAPFTQMPAPGSQWEVSIVHDSSTESKIELAAKAAQAGDATVLPPAVAKKILIRHGRNGVIEEEITYANGRRDVYYFHKDRLFMKASNTDRIYITTPGENSLESDVFDLRLPIPGVRWLAEKYYAGVETLREPCHVFRTKGLPETQLSSELELAVWISTKTRFPVEAKVGKTLYRFSSPREFSGNIELPSHYAEELRKREGL